MGPSVPSGPTPQMCWPSHRWRLAIPAVTRTFLPAPVAVRRRQHQRFRCTHSSRRAMPVSIKTARASMHTTSKPSSWHGTLCRVFKSRGTLCHIGALSPARGHAHRMSGDRKPLHTVQCHASQKRHPDFYHPLEADACQGGVLGQNRDQHGNTTSTSDVKSAVWAPECRSGAMVGTNDADTSTCGGPDATYRTKRGGLDEAMASAVVRSAAGRAAGRSERVPGA